MKLLPLNSFNGEIGATFEFLAEEGGVFTKSLPKTGYYFDLNTGIIGKAETKEMILKLPIKGTGDMSFPIFSTHISRTAGSSDVWGGESPISVFRKAARVRRKGGFQGNAGEGETIDLLRFSYEIQRMTMLNLRGLTTGHVYEGDIAETGANRISVFGIFPEKLDFIHLQGGPVGSSSAETEPVKGQFGVERRLAEVEDANSHIPLFTVDRSTGLLLLDGRSVVGHGFPKSKKGGRSWFTNWDSFPGHRERNRFLFSGADENFQMRHSGIFVNLGKISPTNRSAAVIESLSAMCHLEGPRQGLVLRAKATIVDATRNFGCCLRTRGIPVKNIMPKEWGKIREAELVKLASFVQSAGLSTQARSILPGPKTWNRKTKEAGYKKQRGLDRFSK